MTTRLLKSNVFDYIVCTAVMLFDFYSSQKSEMPCNKGKIYKRLNYVRLGFFYQTKPVILLWRHYVASYA